MLPHTSSEVDTFVQVVILIVSSRPFLCGSCDKQAIRQCKLTGLVGCQGAEIQGSHLVELYEDEDTKIRFLPEINASWRFR